MKKLVPNIITCCNLLSGALAVMLAAEGLFHCAFGMILLGAIFDFFDGMSARALKVNNPIGKEIDSLADVITFGLAPSVMLMQAIRLATENSNYAWGWWSAVALIHSVWLSSISTSVRPLRSSDLLHLPTPFSGARLSQRSRIWLPGHNGCRGQCLQSWQSAAGC